MKNYSSEEGVLAYDIEMPEGSLIAAVSSKDDVEVVSEETRLYPGDTAIIVSDREKVSHVRSLFKEL